MESVDPIRHMQIEWKTFKLVDHEKAKPVIGEYFGDMLAHLRLLGSESAENLEARIQAVEVLKDAYPVLQQIAAGVLSEDELADLTANDFEDVIGTLNDRIQAVKEKERERLRLLEEERQQAEEAEKARQQQARAKQQRATESRTAVVEAGGSIVDTLKHFTVSAGRGGANVLYWLGGSALPTALKTTAVVGSVSLEVGKYGLAKAAALPSEQTAHQIYPGLAPSLSAAIDKGLGERQREKVVISSTWTPEMEGERADWPEWYQELDGRIKAQVCTHRPPKKSTVEGWFAQAKEWIPRDIIDPAIDMDRFWVGMEDLHQRIKQAKAAKHDVLEAGAIYSPESEEGKRAQEEAKQWQRGIDKLVKRKEELILLRIVHQRRTNVRLYEKAKAKIAEVESERFSIETRLFEAKGKGLEALNKALTTFTQDDDPDWFSGMQLYNELYADDAFNEAMKELPHAAVAYIDNLVLETCGSGAGCADFLDEVKKLQEGLEPPEKPNPERLYIEVELDGETHKVKLRELRQSNRILDDSFNRRILAYDRLPSGEGSLYEQFVQLATEVVWWDKKFYSAAELSRQKVFADWGATQVDAIKQWGKDFKSGKDQGGYFAKKLKQFEKWAKNNPHKAKEMVGDMVLFQQYFSKDATLFDKTANVVTAYATADAVINGHLERRRALVPARVTMDQALSREYPPDLTFAAFADYCRLLVYAVPAAEHAAKGAVTALSLNPLNWARGALEAAAGTMVDSVKTNIARQLPGRLSPSTYDVVDMTIQAFRGVPMRENVGRLVTREALRTASTLRSALTEEGGFRRYIREVFTNRVDGLRVALKHGRTGEFLTRLAVHFFLPGALVTASVALLVINPFGLAVLAAGSLLAFGVTSFLIGARILKPFFKATETEISQDLIDKQYAKEKRAMIRQSVDAQLEELREQGAQWKRDKMGDLMRAEDGGLVKDDGHYWLPKDPTKDSDEWEWERWKEKDLKAYLKIQVEEDVEEWFRYQDDLGHAKIESTETELDKVKTDQETDLSQLQHVDGETLIRLLTKASS